MSINKKKGQKYSKAHPWMDQGEIPSAPMRCAHVTDRSREVDPDRQHILLASMDLLSTSPHPHGVLRTYIMYVKYLQRTSPKPTSLRCITSLLLTRSADNPVHNPVPLIVTQDSTEKF